MNNNEKEKTNKAVQIIKGTNLKRYRYKKRNTKKTNK